MSCHLRFFFDPGSGVCLWSANDAARERFDYPVELSELPLSVESRLAGEQLIDRFDTSLDWSDPGGSSPWSESEATSFRAAALAWLSEVERELGSGYEIANEFYVPCAS